RGLTQLCKVAQRSWPWRFSRMTGTSHDADRNLPNKDLPENVNRRAVLIRQNVLPRNQTKRREYRSPCHNLLRRRRAILSRLIRTRHLFPAAQLFAQPLQLNAVCPDAVPVFLYAQITQLEHPRFVDGRYTNPGCFRAWHQYAPCPSQVSSAHRQLLEKPDRADYFYSC